MKPIFSSEESYCLISGIKGYLEELGLHQRRGRSLQQLLDSRWQDWFHRAMPEKALGVAEFASLLISGSLSDFNLNLGALASVPSSHESKPVSNRKENPMATQTAKQEMLAGQFGLPEMKLETALEFERIRHLAEEYAESAMTFLRSGVGLAQYIAQRLSEVRGTNANEPLSAELTTALDQQQEIIEQTLRADNSLATSPLLEA